MVDTHEPCSSPSYKLSSTWTPCSVRIQLTTMKGIGHIPWYHIKTRCSLMRWKATEESFLLVLVPAPEGSWIILYDHDKVLRHLVWAVSGLVSC
jgi:hypothetical protein